MLQLRVKLFSIIILILRINHKHLKLYQIRLLILIQKLSLLLGMFKEDYIVCYNKKIILLNFLLLINILSKH
jgi:hypothetical protein